MIKEGKIGVQEAISLITITITVKVNFTSPAFTAKVVGTASWYMTLISTITALIGFSFVYLLLKRFPGKNLVQAFELSMGRFFGFILSMAVCIYLLVSNAILLREFAEVTKVYVLPMTPPSFVMGALLAMTVGACFLGFESVARFARLVAYFVLAGFITVLVLAWNNYDYHNLFPILGYGIDKTIITGLSRSSFYGEVVILGIIAASMQGTKHIKKAGIISLVISGIVTAAALLASMAAFNYGTASEIVSRVYALTRIIHIGGFLQRLDPFFIFTWNIGSLVGITVIFYASISMYCKIFRIQDMRPVIIPAAILLFSISIIPRDFTSVTDIVHITRQYGWIILYALPFISLAAAKIRGKKSADAGRGGRNANEKGR